MEGHQAESIIANLDRYKDRIDQAIAELRAGNTGEAFCLIRTEHGRLKDILTYIRTVTSRNQLSRRKTEATEV
jgi:hypothetical protein